MWERKAGDCQARFSRGDFWQALRHPSSPHKLGITSPIVSPCQSIKRNPWPSSRNLFHYLLVLLYEVTLIINCLHKPSHHIMRMRCASLNNAWRQEAGQREGWRDGGMEGREAGRTGGRTAGGREAGTAQDTEGRRGWVWVGGARWLQRIKERP